MATCPREACGGFLVEEVLHDGPSQAVHFLVKAARCLMCARIFETVEGRLHVYGTRLGTLANAIKVGSAHGRVHYRKRMDPSHRGGTNEG